MTDRVGSREPGPSADDLRWDKLAREQQYVQLQEVRATAEKWRGGLTALTGLVAITFTITGAETTSDLPTPWRIAVAALQGLSLLVLTFGTWLVMLSAFGSPVRLRDNGPRLRAWVAQEASDAAGRLKIARYATIIGLGLLAAVAVVASLAPSVSPEAVRVVDESGAAYCGTVASDDDGNALTVTARSGLVYRLPVQSLVTVELRAEC